MSLISLFQPHAPATMQATLCKHAEFEEVLSRLIGECQAQYPNVRLSAEEFIPFLARHLPQEIAQPKDLADIQLAELFLVCAYGRGDSTAAAILESQYMPRVAASLLRLSTPPQNIADIMQELRERLFQMQNASVLRRGYSGRSALSGWLCLSAIRAAGLLHARKHRELPLEKAAAEFLPALGKDAESALLAVHFKDLFHSAFQEAVALLSPRERNLLRYHYLMQLSVDQIGAIYRVHRATAARWVAGAKAQLVEGTRQRLLARAPLNTESLPQIMELIRSQVALNLEHVLVVTDDPEAELTP